MKTIIILLISLSFISFANAKTLKSDSLRAEICFNLDVYLYETGLDTSVSSSFFPNMVKNCQKSKKSFVIEKDGVLYNETLKKVVGLNIAINYSGNRKVAFKGSAKLRRSVSLNSSTGALKLGAWKVTDMDVKLKLGKRAVVELANLFADTANIHNGDCSISDYNPKTFSRAKALKKLQKEVSEYNADVEEEDSGYETCKRFAVSDVEDVYSMIEDSEDQGYGSAWKLIKILKERGHILTALGTDVEEWHEHCAYRDVYIYLKNGLLIEVNYDFTT